MPEAETQTADAVLMVRPARFSSNPQTLGSNRFQQASPATEADAAAAREELDRLAATLREHGVATHVFEGDAERHLPDEVFPNNWVSFHADGTVVLYPMMAPNRRLERRRELLDALIDDAGYDVRELLDLTHHERHGRYLEGTGSLVLDRMNGIAYACHSARSHPQVAAEIAARLGYDLIGFEATDRRGHAIYHTNVLMAIGTRFAVICSAAVEASRRAALLDRLAAGGREVIEIGFDALRSFAANLLELRGERPLIALSARALQGLEVASRARLSEHATLVAVPVDTIERLGGGSVRCMLAEIHLPRQSA